MISMKRLEQYTDIKNHDQERKDKIDACRGMCRWCR